MNRYKYKIQTHNTNTDADERRSWINGHRHHQSIDHVFFFNFDLRININTKYKRMIQILILMKDGFGSIDTDTIRVLIIHQYKKQQTLEL